MLNKLKNILETKKVIIDLENYYEKLGWQLDKYFVLKIHPSKFIHIQNKHQTEFMKKSLKILYLLNEYINKIPQNIKNIQEVLYQINEIQQIKIDEKNINIDLIGQLLARYYVLIPYIYICYLSLKYINNHISVKFLIKKLSKKDISKITLKSPKIIDIWKNICDESEYIKNFDEQFNEIFNKYINL